MWFLLINRLIYYVHFVASLGVVGGTVGFICFSAICCPILLVNLSILEVQRRVHSRSFGLMVSEVKSLTQSSKQRFTKKE